MHRMDSMLSALPIPYLAVSIERDRDDSDVATGANYGVA